MTKSLKAIFSVLFLFFLFGFVLLAQKKSEKKDNSVPEEEFNKLQEMGGSRRYNVRDDYVWGTNTAFTTKPRTGDISLFSQTRLGLTRKIELNSNILLNRYVPNLFFKYRYREGKVWIASKHGVYFPNMGLNLANSKGYLINHSDSVTIPFIGCLRNEIILSYPVFDKMSCNSTQPYLIFSIIGGVDYGLATNSWDANSFTVPWLEPRSKVLLGKGFTFNIVARVDYIYFDYLKIESEIGVVMDPSFVNLAIENRTVLKYFLFQNLSVSAGWMCSFAKSSTKPKFGILPYLDLTFYFGSKQNKMKGLWKDKMY